ncbi:SDR family NAD(P)-dependent oxidoreductase [Sulfidibacter corallicola]|uniref:SDR family NAD(P)-dependent oxidoreductase n=1 Tax=Sulfidibacter corallicola TaxID=2818388 RepID=A0A8A4TI19_SULCO|nr:type I polyketide synthase [Sulfidibacter corallicola]QTD48802.1 SDR family NAD(P)-dependent oxidoreductase [Sulfidibacter corallicola]
MSQQMEQEEIPGIAIVGMAGRFPGATDVARFWRNLAEGIEAITFFSDEELLELGFSEELLANPSYVKAGGCIDDIDQFDAAFFGFNPREAEITDPQQRLLLETAYQALQDAAYDPETYEGRIGVFASVGLPHYFLENLLQRPDVMIPMGGHRTMIANDKGYAATLISYKLNLTGPSINVDTACSTTLVAVHMACKSLLSYEADMVLTGGAKLRIPQKSGYWHEKGGISSPDGHCRAFDADAGGTIFGCGMGMVVLKRLEDAVADGDAIYAVIKGSAINNDGSAKIGYTAPSVTGQSEVIAEAQAFANVDPATIGYVEAHGTGTQLGDPIEMEALTEAFRLGTDKTGYCALGSVKTNIGHLDNAAGVTGLMKTALSLKHAMIPPSLHFQRANPQIDFDNSPFFVNTEARQWSAGEHPRRAGVSSFGIGGTNAHAILEEAPHLPPSSPGRRFQLLPLSAKTETALDAAVANLAQWLEGDATANLADVAWTLQAGRTAFPCRRFLVCDGHGDAIAALHAAESRRMPAAVAGESTKVVFMFPGQGAQHVHMAAGLYRDEPEFRRHLDDCAERLKPLLDLDLRDLLYPNEDAVEAAAEKLGQTAYTQPALFCVSYALAKLWMSWGLTPAAMIGHSIGEYVAACLAEVFGLDDALALVCARAGLMQSLPPGRMIAVPLEPETLAPLLDEHCSLAAVNAPGLCVVSGRAEAIEALEARLKAEGHAARALHTSHAFHSPMMDPILSQFTERVGTVALQPPQIPIISNLTGAPLTDKQAVDPAYWADHLRGTVRFADGIRHLAQDPDHVYLEVGAGQVLTALVKRIGGRDLVSIPSCRKPTSTDADQAVLLDALGRLWLTGTAIDWRAHHGDDTRHRLHLPTYAFDRQRYWIDAKPPEEQAAQKPKKRDGKLAIDEWFYQPTWKRIETRRRTRPNLKASPSTWLLFETDQPLDRSVAARLEAENQKVVRVRAGDAFAQLDAHRFTVNPERAEDYRTLAKTLGEADLLPDHVIHLWSTTPRAVSATVAGAFAGAQSRGLYSLLYLTQALTGQVGSRPVRIAAAGTHLQDVLGGEPIEPEKSTLMSAARVIPQEHSNFSVTAIDVPVPDEGSADAIAEGLIAELTVETRLPMVALRGRNRWIQTFEPFALEAPAEDGSGALLKDGGTYLITGGLGGIGLVMAEHLARTRGANLILTARTPLPDHEQWSTYLESSDANETTVRRIEAIRAMEAEGAKVRVWAADVTDRARMEEILAATETEFGALNGVIHSAGLLGPKAFTLVGETTSDTCAAHFQAKVEGLLVLESLLRGRSLDFCLLMSSISSILGGLGYLGYASGNTFMDAFTQHLETEHTWISVDWDAWQLDGPAGTKLAIGAVDGMAALDRVLQEVAPPRLVVSTGDLDTRLRQWILQEPQHETAQEIEKPAGHARPQLDNDYEAPRDSIEEGLAEIWQDLLGFDRIGIHDHFADLGGHSLLATQLISRIREHFQVEVPLHELFSAPTIAGLAMIVLQKSAEDTNADQLEAMLAELEGMDEADLAALLAEEEAQAASQANQTNEEIEVP